jgi:hypothetical protein
VTLQIVPCDLADANAFVAVHHRHHGPVIGHKFSIGVTDAAGSLRGVAIVGRPNARHLDDGWTLEVTRLATDGCPHACSALYAAAWRAARAMGYRKVVTYILASERGTSLKAAGWACVGSSRGGSWNCISRPRIDKHPLQSKLRWEVTVA